ncbi:hypothetical protein PR048_012254 [Dryococelus australis]|uniref:Uncharacterized protein n=1 Tax=Dryococelus australis TaxID=614101 RepID=A0ABQ9HNU9_9NEOP|nr:hypothetical protein PR048_012254 [Dryococelus australis]
MIPPPYSPHIPHHRSFRTPNHQTSPHLNTTTATLQNKGATLDDWLDCSPPTKANRVQSPAESLQDFRKWESCRTMLLVGGFSWGFPVSPPPLHSGAAPCSPHFTLIVSQHLVVNSCPNLSAQLNSVLKEQLKGSITDQINLNRTQLCPSGNRCRLGCFTQRSVTQALNKREAFKLAVCRRWFPIAITEVVLGASCFLQYLAATRAQPKENPQRGVKSQENWAENKGRLPSLYLSTQLRAFPAADTHTCHGGSIL